MSAATEILEKICSSTEKREKSSKRDNIVFSDYSIHNPKVVETITKDDLLKSYNQAVADNTVEERLFHIFYCLDEGK